MESNNYESFITQTVESMLPRFHDTNICLAMKVDMEWTDHGYGEDGNTKIRDSKSFIKELLLVFHRSSNYTLVLGKDITKEQHFFIDKKEMDMERYSYHDSCWRSDGMRWVFKTFVEAWDYFEQFGVEGRDIDPHFYYSMFRGSPAYYHIEKMEAKRDDEFVYNIKIGEEIPMHEISQYMPKPL